MDYSIAWGGHPEDVLMKTGGVATVAALDAMVCEALSDHRWRAGMNILVDHTDCDWSFMSVSDVERCAGLLMAGAEEIGYQRIAFVFGHYSDLGVARTLSTLVDDGVAYVAHAFMSVEEGREWLAHAANAGEEYVLVAGGYVTGERARL
jgi:hypothetical protein